MQKLINRLKKTQLRRKHYFLSLSLLILIALKIWYIFLLPNTLFDVPYSTVVEDDEGILLSAIIADDGQWRFPQSSEVPEKFKTCITEFEDSRFRWHPGVNIFSILRAAYTNIKSGRIVSGGSTITMQVIRLSRNDKPRTLWEKFIEIIYATRLEFSYSKDEILNMYSSHAPFGGNVVGLEAASWRYYGVAPDQLSWGQAATLAVLPNAPSLIYPGKNETVLLKKRNRLLKKLYDKDYFSQDIYESAISEPLPGKPKQLPAEGIHIMNRVISDGMKGQRIQTTIRHDLQNYVQDVANRHVEVLSGNKVHNAAAIVIDVKSGAVIAYVGNSTNSTEYQNQVDIINSLRSPGSTLKPLLYCAMLNEGMILPDAIVPDIPTFLEGFSPQNFNKTYEGIVPASMALSRSLNVPAVHMLKMYGIGKFNLFLQKAGFTTFIQPPSHYGLSIILGGAEVKLYELAGVYASMARILLRYGSDQTYSDEDVFSPWYIKSDKKQDGHGHVFTSASAIWYTFQAMVDVNRPEEDQFWFHFSSRSPVAWKTGTSYGDRDAWAVGVTPGYVVGVWAGNATGEGRPGLTGLTSAAPLMFEIFDYLPKSGWFQEPSSEMIPLTVCSKSGYKASHLCEETYVQKLPSTGFRSKTCPYHKTVHLDKTGQWQVNANCEVPQNIHSISFFVLPPVMEYFHQLKNPFYTTLPPFRSDCQSDESETNFGIIYPVNDSKIYLIEDQSNNQGQLVFRAAHRKTDAVLHWHLDGEFIGSTSDVHTIAVKPESGKHKLVVVDHTGETKSCSFEILNKK